MPSIIQKYGGKTLATPADILQVAGLVHARVKSGSFTASQKLLLLK